MPTGRMQLVSLLKLLWHATPRTVAFPCLRCSSWKFTKVPNYEPSKSPILTQQSSPTALQRSPFADRLSPLNHSPPPAGRYAMPRFFPPVSRRLSTRAAGLQYCPLGRDAFCFPVQRGRTAFAVWVDVAVPAGRPAGTDLSRSAEPWDTSWWITTAWPEQHEHAFGLSSDHWANRADNLGFHRT